MFDSENIPLVTRVEAGPGVNISYVSNNSGEGVWTATIDDAYIYSLISNRISDSEIEAIKYVTYTTDTRLDKIEELLGVKKYYPKSTTTDSDIFRFIKYDQSVPALTANLSIRWKIISFDGSSIISKTNTFAQGSTKDNVLTMLLYSIKNTTSVMNYLNVIRLDDGFDKIHFNWKPIYEGFTLSIQVLETYDPVKFVINQ